MEDNKIIQNKRNFTINLIFTLLIVFQPFIWYLVYTILGGPSAGSTYALDIVCFISPIIGIMASLWMREYMISGKNLFEDF